MLPFRDQKSKTGRAEEIELEDDDLVIVDVASPASPASAAPPSIGGGSGARRKHTLPPGSRRVLAERVEEDVAGQCLASLAESRAHSSSHVRAAFARPSVDHPSAYPPPLPVAPIASAHSEREHAPISVSRLPAVSAPPLQHTSRTNIGPFLRSRHAEEAPGVRDSSPPPAFVRRSSASFQAATPSSFTSARPSSVNSLAPVSANVLRQGGPRAHHAASATPPEHTLIVVRERPRAAWIFAAAALGALGAIAATRFLAAGDATTAGDERGQNAVTTLSAASPAVGAPALPPAVVVAPPPAPAPAPALPARPGPAVMSFADDQGVAIRAHAPPAPRAPASPAAPAPRAPRPATPSRQGLGPALPDGSLSLGSSSSPSTPARVSSPAAAAPAVAAPAPPPAAPVAPEPPRKPRVLTPEQQLAEAQLKASMK